MGNHNVCYVHIYLNVIRMFVALSDIYAAHKTEEYLRVALSYIKLVQNKYEFNIVLRMFGSLK